MLRGDPLQGITKGGGCGPERLDFREKLGHVSTGLADKYIMSCEK